MKIIQSARFAAIPEPGDEDRHEMKRPAEIEIDGIHLFSEEPKTAAQALKINEALEHVIGITN